MSSSESDSGEISETFKNSKSIEILAKLFKNSETTDAFFVFKRDNAAPIRISAHRNILAQGSPVFHQMFYGSLRETGDIQIHDASPEAFDKFLQFFYLNEVTLTNEYVAEVLYLSSKYDMLQCSRICENFLEDIMNEDTMCWGYDLAILYDLKRLENLCAKEIAFDASRILKSKSFQNCSREMLKRILLRNDLNCTEVEILDACMKWAETQISLSDSSKTLSSKRLTMDALTLTLDRRERLGACFDLIRFQTMTADQISECLRNHCGILNIDEIEYFESGPMESRRIWKPPTGPYSEEIYCERFIYEADSVGKGPQSYKDLAHEASFTFSTNKRIFLTGLGGEAISSRHFGSVLRVNLEIWTKSAGSWLTRRYDQLLFKRVEDISRFAVTSIAFSEAIVINAFQNYEIKIKFIDDPLFMYLKINIKDHHKKVLLNDGTEVKFHSSNDYNTTNGLISKLCFVSFY